MERPRPEYLVLVFVLYLSLPTPGDLKTGVRRTFSLESKMMKWSNARLACKDTNNMGFHRLATARNNSEVEMLSQLCNSEGEFTEAMCFVGLIKHNDAWYWLNGEENSLPLQHRQQVYGSCAVVFQDKLHVHPCGDAQPYICERFFVVLVKERKTWEEALLDCRAKGVGKGYPPIFDLLSLHSLDDLSYAQEELVYAEMQHLWVGLRWLAGRWLWIDGKGSWMSRCPANGTHCGSISRKGMHFSSCTERRNFLCQRVK